MACLIRRNNGIYYALTCERGKQRWASLQTRDYAEAQGLFQELDEKRKREVRSLTSDFFEDFLRSAPLNYSDKTITMYAQAFKNFLRICGDRKITDMAAFDAENFRRKRVTEISPVSTNIEIRTLKAAFNQAKKLKLTQENPFQEVKPVRVPHKEAAHLTETEYRKLLSVIDDPEFGDLVRFAVFTMLRRGEIAHLRWENVDLERKEIRVKSDSGFTVKGGRPRTVPMNNWVHGLLISKERKGEYVFSQNGCPLAPIVVSKKFKAYCRKAGLVDAVHFHSLRHTGISWLVNKGVPAPFVKRIAGHSSLNVTELYTHLEDGNLLTAINALPALN